MRAPYSPLPDHGATPSLPVLQQTRTSPAATPAPADASVLGSPAAAVTANGTPTVHNGSRDFSSPAPTSGVTPTRPHGASGASSPGAAGGAAFSVAGSKHGPSGPVPRASPSLAAFNATLAPSRGSTSTPAAPSVFPGATVTAGSRVDTPAMIHRPTVARSRFPCSIVWTPIPLITWILPFVGHMGICDSRGVIHDFAGPYFIGVDDMAFGEPTRYLPLGDLLFPPPVFRRLLPRQLQQALATLASAGNGAGGGGGPAGGVDTMRDVEAAYQVDMGWLRGGASGGGETSVSKSAAPGAGARRVPLDFDGVNPQGSHHPLASDELTDLAHARDGPLPSTSSTGDMATHDGAHGEEDIAAGAALHAAVLAGGIQTAEQRLRAFDRAIEGVSEHFRRTQMYNFFCNNCHSFVATCLMAADVPRAAPGGLCGSRGDAASCMCFVYRSGAAGGGGDGGPSPTANSSGACPAPGCSTTAAAVAAARKRSDSNHGGTGNGGQQKRPDDEASSLSTDLALTIAGGRYCCCGCAAYAPPSTWNMVWLGAYMFLFGRWVSLRRMIVTLLPFTLILVAVILMSTLIPHK